MRTSNLKLFRTEYFKVLLCNKTLIAIDLKWLKYTQNLTGSPLYGEKLPVVTNIGNGRIKRQPHKRLLLTGYYIIASHWTQHVVNQVHDWYQENYMPDKQYDSDTH